MPVFVARPPGPRLRHVIRRLWYLEETAAYPTPSTIYPDGCIELVVHLGTPPRRLAPDGRIHVQSETFVLCEPTRPVTLLSHGHLRTAGVSLIPGASRRWLKQPMRPLVGEAISLDSIDPRLDERLRDRLGATRSPEEALDTLEEELLQVLSGDSPHDPVHRIRSAIQSQPGTSLASLAAMTGIAPRTIQRLCREGFGMGARRFGRLMRFQAVSTAMRNRSTNLTATALQFGYFDYSHMVRDFREFADRTPAQFVAEHSRLGEGFLEDTT